MTSAPGDGAAPQLTRYVIVGLVSNAVLYVFYLGLTAAGMGHKLAMTLLYALGVVQTFVFNRRWTFRFRGAVPGAAVRYLAAYAAGYAANFLSLYVFVDRLGVPHQAVQGASILAVAVLIFAMQKYWVFAPADPQP